MIARRQFLHYTAAAAAAPLLGSTSVQAAAPSSPARTFATATGFAALEQACAGRLGVAVLAAAGEGSGRVLAGHRLDERFPLCSTFKALLAASVLDRAAQSPALLERRLAVTAADLLEYAPVTRRHVGKTMTVRDLCRATVTTSDNTAANLLLDAFGGPPALTAFLRGLGDTVTRCDRREPELNLFTPDDPRDTTTPQAMATTLARLANGAVLAPAARQQWADWLIDNQTGDACLRAGLGSRWRVGDKTGANGEGARNDVAVLWPLGGGSPHVVVAYLQAGGISFAERADVLAQVGRIAEAMIG